MAQTAGLSKDTVVRALCEHGTPTKAAKALGVSDAALYHHIKGMGLRRTWTTEAALDEVLELTLESLP